MKTNILNLIVISALSCLLFSCDDFLDSKPRLELEVPENLDELRALLSNEQRMNEGAVIDMIASDDFYHTKDFIDSQDNPLYFNAYKRFLTPDMYGDAIQPEWTILYSQIYTSNFCLQQINNIPRTSGNAIEWDQVKGIALFKRAYAYSELLKIFAPILTEQTSGVESIPLVLIADINSIESFTTLEKIYEQLFIDLLEAEPLLNDIPDIRTRASKSSVYALKARVYLSINEFEKALREIDKSLAI